MAGRKKGFSIAHVNVRSLTKNFNETYMTMDGFDIICVSESWLHELIPNSMIAFDGYTIYRQDRCKDNSCKKRGGGLVAYVKNSLSTFSNLIIPQCKVTPNLEQLWLEICKPLFKRQIICIIYRPPSGTIKDFITELNCNIEILDDSISSYELTLLGDFNINYRKTNMSDFKALKELERKYQLKQYITDPTRVTNTVKSTIDLLFTNMTMVCEAGVMSTMIADHFPIYIIKKKDRNDKSFTSAFGRSYKNYSTEVFQDIIITNMRWRSFWVKTNNPDDLWDIMLSIITEAADCICPIVRMKIRNSVPGWISKEIIEAINTKKELMKMFQKSGLENEWTKFKNQKRLVKRMLVQSRRNTILASLDENRKNPKRFWRTLNHDLGLSEKKSKGGHSFNRIRDDSGEILEGQQACSFMSNYYALNGVKLASKFNNIDKTTLPPNAIRPEEVFNFSFIPMDVINKLVKEIEVSKSSGIPYLSSRLLKDAFTVLVPELTHIFNESIDTEIFPTAWCMGHITPIPKEGDPLDPGNWRPITILPLPSKLLEKAIHYQVSLFLERNFILDSRQHGFRPNFSTSTAIFQLVKDLFNSYDEGRCTSCIFVDYRKAFETLDHVILCQKLIDYNFSPKSVKWFRSYLVNRKHAVCTNSLTSEPSIVRYGVPQGSTLGPLLFIIYVNDLLFSLETAARENVIMYADDTVLYVSDQDPMACVKNSQRLLDELYRWCQKNKLTINISKTKHMFVARRKDQLPQVKTKYVTVNKESLNNVDSYKYLGVDIDYGLSFDLMADNIYNRANRRLYTMKLIRPYITNGIANLIYKTCIRPILEYADFLIDSCTKLKVDKLERIQKRAVKIIDGYKHKGAKYEDVLMLYGLDNLGARRNHHHLAVMYRHSNLPGNIETYRPGINLRSNNKLKFKIKTTQLTKVQNSPFYRGVSLWDRLPVEVQRATTKVKFKKCIVKNL